MEAKNAVELCQKLFELDMDPEYRAAVLGAITRAMSGPSKPKAEMEQRRQVKKVEQERKAAQKAENEKKKQEEQKVRKEKFDKTMAGQALLKTKDLASKAASSVSSTTSSIVEKASRVMSPTKEKDPEADYDKESCDLSKHPEFGDKTCREALKDLAKNYRCIESTKI